MICVLAEKPDVATKIAGALGGIQLPDGGVISFEQLRSKEKQVNGLKAKGYFETTFQGQPCTVTWGYGHLCELKQAEDYDAAYKNWRKMPMPFIPAKYELQPRLDGGRMDAMVKTQLKVIKDLFSKADYIINATDFDREGEVIFAYIYEYLKCKKPVKRACFSSMTKEGFREAFDTLKDGVEMKPTEMAGRMRSIADWVVGANVTVAMTLRDKRRDVLSVGRVQTPTLNIVVRREKEIRNFKPETYYTVDALFTTSKGEQYKGTHQKKRFQDPQEAEAELKKLQAAGRGTVTAIEKKPVRRGVPHLYSLASLQMDCNSRFNMTLKQTLDTAQSLYSKGFTTYPRTSSQFLTEDMGPVVSRVLGGLKKQSDEYNTLIGERKVPYGNKYWFDNSKVDSHYAIIPTGTKPTGLTEYEKKVYDLIARSVIRMLYGSAELEETKVTTEVADSLFQSSGSVIVDPGWMAVSGMAGESALPALREGEQVSAAFEKKEKKTEPPKRYSDKTLLSAMISCGKDVEDEELRKVLEDPNVNGIGTSATRDSIIETLIKRSYMERRGKVFYATDKGISLIDGLPLEDLKGAELTARWEQRMSAIEHGKEDATVFRKEIEKQTGVWTETIKGSTPPPPPAPIPTDLVCPKCGAPIQKYGWGLACANWKDKAVCGFSIGTVCGVIVEEEDARVLLEGNETRLIRNFVGRTKRRFNAKLRLKEDYSVEFLFEDRPREETEVEILPKPGEDRTEEVLRHPCPKCGKPLQVTETGYACTECNWNFGTACHKRLSDEEVLNYLTNGETGMLEGFISKRGKPFTANLKMRANKTMQYLFDNSARPAGRKTAAKKADNGEAPAGKTATGKAAAAKPTAKKTATAKKKA